MASPSKNAKTFYTIKFVQKNGKSASEIVEKLGTETFIKETYGVDDAEAWVRSHVNEFNAAEKAAKDVEHFVRFSTNELIPAGKQLSFNTGYLFLQKIYYQLGLPSICKKIKKDNAFTYDLNAILSRLVYEGYDEERDIAFDQTLIVTYSLKYKLYQQTIRERQVERAKKYLQQPAQYDKHSVTDAHLSFLQALLPALCTDFHIVYFLTFLFPPFLPFPILFL